VSWKSAIERRDGPSALIFSRQNLPHQPRIANQVADIAKGGYVLKDCAGTPDAVIIATGSEVSLAVGAADRLNAAGKKVRVVSMPCAEIFSAQTRAYRDAVLPPAVRARVAVEAAHVDYWHKFVGLDGAVVGMTSFGASAPAKDLYNHFGITEDKVVEAVEQML
jgi:transketolase